MSVFSVITAVLGLHIKGDLRQPEELIAIGRDSGIALGAGSACVCVCIHQYMICFPCGGSQVSGVCFYAVLSLSIYLLAM